MYIYHPQERWTQFVTARCFCVCFKCKNSLLFDKCLNCFGHDFRWIRIAVPLDRDAAVYGPPPAGQPEVIIMCMTCEMQNSLLPCPHCLTEIQAKFFAPDVHQYLVNYGITSKWKYGKKSALDGYNVAGAECRCPRCQARAKLPQCPACGHNRFRFTGDLIRCALNCRNCPWQDSFIPCEACGCRTLLDYAYLRMPNGSIAPVWDKPAKQWALTG